MKNVDYTIKAGKLVITVDVGAAACAKAKPSTSGKTQIVGSTEGAIKFEGPPGWDLSFSMNVMGKSRDED